MRQLLLIGYLGQDAKVNQYQGKQIINFSIADSEKYKNAEGVEVTKTTWIECAIWKDAGQSIVIANYLKKGTQVMVQGVPDVSTYTNKDGRVVAKFSLKVSNCQLLGNASPRPEPNTNVASTDAVHNAEPGLGTPPAAGGSDDLPF
jgi:single-strand DNA-binding protein